MTTIKRALILIALSGSTVAHAVTFDASVVDSGVAGDCKAVADIDGDGLPDLVVGGLPNERLNWYRAPSWSKTVIATPSNEFTTDCGAADMDGDGDIDLVTPDGNSGDNIVWYQNPLSGGGNPAVGSQWVRRTVGAVGNWAKDVDLADFDADGRFDIATRTDVAASVFFQTAANVWSKVTLNVTRLGVEGMTSGDIDHDGDVDLVVQGAWLANPGQTSARSAGNWTEHVIGSAPSELKALVTDVDGDGRADVVFSSSEGTADVRWWSADAANPRGTWTGRTIVAGLERAHTLEAADMDKDGDTDLVIGQMHTSAGKELAVYLNANGAGTQWTKEVVDQGSGLHNGVVADVGSDGDFDIFGANWAGNPPVRLWENESSPISVAQWTYIQVSNGNQQTFGLACGDVDGDRRTDIVTGARWYRNPGASLDAAWAADVLPSGMHAILMTDVDGDTNADVIAQRDLNGITLYWLERQGTAWAQVVIGTVPAASHAIGFQGYRVAELGSGGKPEVLVTSGDGIYYFTIPANAAAGGWPRVHVNSNPSDEGFAVGDIDRDGRADIAATTGDAKGVEWYRNPGDGSSSWTAFPIGSFTEALYPDRTEIADFNGDGKLDIVVSEENGDSTGAETFWWQQPADPRSTNWSRQLLTTQGTTNSMHVADMDADGDADVVTAEHRGQLRVIIWQSARNGTFTARQVGAGRESHLGALPCDLDRDGDLDIVSIAWDDFAKVHLWRNDASRSGPPPAVPNPPGSLTAN